MLFSAFTFDTVPAKRLKDFLRGNSYFDLNIQSFVELVLRVHNVAVGIVAGVRFKVVCSFLCDCLLNSFLLIKVILQLTHDFV